MLLPWRRRGGAARHPPRDNAKTTSAVLRQAATSQIHHTQLLQRTPVPESTQSEPADQHQQSVILAAPGRCQIPLSESSSTTDGAAPSYAKNPFVSRLLPPVRFRRRQPSGLQRENSGWGPQSNSVPADLLSRSVDSVTGATRLPSHTSRRSSNHAEGTLRSAGTQATPAALKGTGPSKNVDSLPAATSASTAAPRARQGSVLEVFRAAAATARGSTRTRDVSKAQGNECGAEVCNSKEEECRLSRQRPKTTDEGCLEAAAAARLGESAHRDTPLQQRGLYRSAVREGRLEARERESERTLFTGLDSSTQFSVQHSRRDQPAAVAPTTKHTATSAVAAGGTTSCERESGPQMEVSAPQPWAAPRGSVQQKSMENPPCSLQTPPVEESTKPATKFTLSFARRIAAAKNSLSHADKSAPQKMETEKAPSEENKASERRTTWRMLSTLSTKEDAQGEEENEPSTTTSCGESPQPMAGVQRQVSSTVITRWQEGHRATSPEESPSLACAAVARWKAQDALQLGKQTAPNVESVRQTRCRSLPSALGVQKMHTIWSVEGLSDALIVRRGLATVLLMDRIGNAALLRRALSTPGEWQQYLQRTSVTDCNDAEDVKILMEMPPKVRSKHVILSLLQGVVSLQQVLPVDVTYAQADLRLLSLQQLLVLRLRNSHENELTSTYHSCHASFLRSLDCRIAELLGAFLVNEAVFELFAPLVEEQKQQQKLRGAARIGEESGSFCATGTQQSLTQQDTQANLSYSGASTRSSSPQNVHTRGGAGGLVAGAATEGGGGAEQQRQSEDGGERKQRGCSDRNDNGAGPTAGAANGESGEERKLRGHVSWAWEVRTHRVAVGNGGNVRVSIVEGGEKAEASLPELRNCVWTALSKAAAAAKGAQTAGSTEKRGPDRPADEHEGLQREPQQEQHRVGKTQEFGSHSTDRERTKDTTGRQENAVRRNFAANEEKSRAALVETQARFLVRSVAEKGLLSTYSASSFDIPAGEAATDRSQLRALGAAFVRQLGVVVSAAGKTGGTSNSGRGNSSGVSAADLCVLHRVQKYVLQGKCELQLKGETAAEDVASNNMDTVDAGGRQTNMLQSPVGAKKCVTTGECITTMDGSAAASAAGVSRPAGVWIRLLVPCQPGTANVKRAPVVRGAVGDSPVLTTPSAAAAVTGCGTEKATVLKLIRQTGKEGQGGNGDGLKVGEVEGAARPPESDPRAAVGADRQEEKRGTSTEAEREVETAAIRNATAGGARSELHTPAIVPGAARADLIAAIAATRLRKATNPTAETEVQAQSVEEKRCEKEWMEAFLWLRLPSHSEGSAGRNNTGAAARKTANQNAPTLQQQQQRGETQVATAAAAEKSARSRGVFELVVSNDRPVGEVLLWGLAPQSNQTLCRSSGPGCSTAGSCSNARARWTVAAIPQTAVLQQHLGNDGKVTDVVSELKELLSKRCGAMKPAAEYVGGGRAIAAAATSARTPGVGRDSPCC